MKKLLRTASTAVGAVALGGAGFVQALSLGDAFPIEKVLFPIVSTAPGTFTFLTLLNDNGGIADSHLKVRYRLTYGHKRVQDGPTDPCALQDFSIDVTENFLLQFEARLDDPFLAHTVFGEDHFAALQTPPLPLLPLPAGRHAFLIVEVVDEPDSDEEFTDRVSLSGEAVVVNLGVGLRWAYSTRETGLPSAELLLGSDETSFELLDGSDKTTFWYPEEFVGTVWHVLPLGTREEMIADGGGGISMFLRPETSNDPSNRGAFGQEEAFFSGTTFKEVKCFAFFNRPELLPPPDLAKGGWMSLAGYQGEPPEELLAADQNFMLHKIQFVPAGGSSQVPPGTTDTVISRESGRHLPESEDLNVFFDDM